MRMGMGEKGEISASSGWLWDDVKNPHWTIFLQTLPEIKGSILFKLFMRCSSKKEGWTWVLTAILGCSLVILYFYLRLVGESGAFNLESSTVKEVSETILPLGCTTRMLANTWHMSYPFPLADITEQSHHSFPLSLKQALWPSIWHCKQILAIGQN